MYLQIGKKLKGFTRRGLYHMRQLYELYGKDEKVSPPVIQFFGVSDEKV